MHVLSSKIMKTKDLKIDDGKLISGPHLARIVDVSPATPRRWRREGCPCHLLGNGLIRYKLEEVLAWRRGRR
jgi:hypothetical protein